MPPELNEWPLWRSELSGSNGVIGRILLKNSKVERLSKSSPSRLRRMYASRWCRKSAVRLRRYLDRSRRGPSRLSIPDESSTLKIQGLCVFQQYRRKTDMRARRRIRQMMNALIYFERDSEVRLCGVAFE
jgi:hypothetical protein